MLMWLTLTYEVMMDGAPLTTILAAILTNVGLGARGRRRPYPIRAKSTPAQCRPIPFVPANPASGLDFRQERRRRR